MDESFELEQNDLDNLIIKDRKFYAKKKKKCLLICISILLVIITGIVLYLFLKPKIDNKIICQYETLEDNENVILINIDDIIDFILIIDEIEYDKKKSHNFQKAGKHKVIFQFEKKLNSLESLFEGNKYIIDADFSMLQTENIKSMENLFKDCTNLTNVNFDNKTPNLKNTMNMFLKCKLLKEVKMNFNTTNIERMDNMFNGCESLTYLDISGFNLENLKNSYTMFADCRKLKEIKFNNNTTTKNLETMEGMFYNCQSLVHITTKIFKQNKLKNLNKVFNYCISLKEIDLSYFETTYMTELRGTFQNCKSLEKINFTNFDTTNIEKMDHIFFRCESLIYLDISGFNLENLKNSYAMFADCIKLKDIKFNNSTLTKNLETMEGMFTYCYSLEHMLSLTVLL